MLLIFVVFCFCLLCFHDCSPLSFPVICIRATIGTGCCTCTVEPIQDQAIVQTRRLTYLGWITKLAGIPASPFLSTLS